MDVPGYSEVRWAGCMDGMFGSWVDASCRGWLWGNMMCCYMLRIGGWMD